MSEHSQQPDEVEEDDDWVSDSETAKEFSVCLKTIDRWDKDPKLNFPKVEGRIRNRKYRSRRKLRVFKRQRRAGATAA
jgi:hypothetical protein